MSEPFKPDQHELRAEIEDVADCLARAQAQLTALAMKNYKSGRLLAAEGLVNTLQDGLTAAIHAKLRVGQLVGDQKDDWKDDWKEGEGA